MDHRRHGAGPVHDIAGAGAVLRRAGAGCSIAFGPGESGIWGGPGRAFLTGADVDSLAGTLPEVLFFARIRQSQSSRSDVPIDHHLPHIPTTPKLK